MSVHADATSWKHYCLAPIVLIYDMKCVPVTQVCNFKTQLVTLRRSAKGRQVTQKIYPVDQHR